MKLTLVCILGLLATTSAIDLSPVTRVVQLLQGLSKQIEEDGKKEEDLYETFVCWGQSVIEQKTAANVEANSKIDELEAYIADLEAGRVELSTERVDLEKEIEGLRGDMEMATALRTKENQDFQMAEDEMKKGVAALKSAVDVLGEATKNHKKGTLLAVRQRLNGGMEAFAQQQINLKNAVEFGQRFLSKGDSLFLQRLLLGDVPTVDWKKLNRKATFKMAYKERSTKIQDVLKKMHQTFTINLKDARANEKKSKDSYDTLSAAKQGQLDTATDAYNKMAGENGARGMSKQDSKDEVASLKTQVGNDEKFIKETTTSLADKKKEWKTRSTLRTGELAAISKTIGILHSDDARDLMKRSAASQGFFFLQTEMTAASGAAAALRDAARRSGDERLLTLAKALASPSVKTQFGPVLKAVDKMIALLKSDEQKDLDIKQTCEKDRMDNTQKAVVAGREIDDSTDKITRLTEEIAKLKKEIEDLQAEHDKVKAELKAASDIRKDENTAWQKTDKDDKEAAATVGSAKDVLAGFYKDNNLNLVQKAVQPATTNGAAPPPPPATWDAGGYGGKTGESQGIVALLDMVQKDIEKDRATAKSEEDQSQSAFDKFEKESNDQMKELTSDMNDRSKTKGQKETNKQNTIKSRKTKKGELDATMQLMKDINPNCEYYEVNYPLRRKNRQIELDGLEKAKTILTGGTFDAAPDPNRAIKPGDAFLQRRA